MPRSDSSEFRYNEHGQDTWTFPEEESYRVEVADPSRFAPAATCGICGRDRRAVATCAACGDVTDVEELAA